MEHPLINPIRLSGQTGIKNKSKKKKKKERKKGRKKREGREKRRKKKKQNKTKSVSITREMPTCCAVSSVRQSDMVYPGNGFGAGSLDLRDKRFVARQSRRWPPLTRARIRNFEVD